LLEKRREATVGCGYSTHSEQHAITQG
jgi:hypothetical protein